MQVELVTAVMVERKIDNHILVQRRKLKYPGISLPGGHVEKGESISDCAIREVKEETGLNVKDLKLCGIVHWAHKITDDRYICFMYKTDTFDGQLDKHNREGENIWMNKDQLFSIPKEQFSSPVYALSPLLHQTGDFSEAYIMWTEESDDYVIQYK